MSSVYFFGWWMSILEGKEIYIWIFVIVESFYV